jgi:hypothetical protein
MKKAKGYSPQLSREIVSRLYFRAKAERIPMTRLASRLIEEALGPDESNQRARDKDSNAGQNAE